jgi:hypothetical protein
LSAVQAGTCAWCETIAELNPSLRSKRLFDRMI